MIKVISLRSPWTYYPPAIRYHMVTEYGVIEFSDKSLAAYNEKEDRWFIRHAGSNFKSTEAYAFCMMTREVTATWDQNSDRAKQIKSALSSLTIEGTKGLGYLIKSQGQTVDIASDLIKAQRKWAQYAQKLLTDL